MLKVDGKQARSCSGSIVRLRRNHITVRREGRLGPNIGFTPHGDVPFRFGDCGLERLCSQ